MRELKFRMPCKCKNGHLSFLFYSVKSGDTYNFRWEREAGCNCLISQSKCATDEQWTGFKARDGVDIYEGDIVSTKIGNVRVIVFRDGSFHSQVYGWEEGKDMPTHPVHFWSLNDDLSPRVIGNVHQNPDLLAVKP